MILRDMLDGFFPGPLKHEFPDGIPIKVTVHSWRGAAGTAVAGTAGLEVAGAALAGTARSGVARSSGTPDAAVGLQGWQENSHMSCNMSCFASSCWQKNSHMRCNEGTTAEGAHAFLQC